MLGELLMSIPLEDFHFIFNRLSESIKILSGRSLFITGGTGFFGKWLLEVFIYINKQIKDPQKKIKISVLSRNYLKFQKDYSYLCNDIQFYLGDIETFEFPKEKFNIIIHAATVTDINLHKKYPMQTLLSITNGLKRVLDFATFANVEKILFISSGAVYGKQPHHILKMEETYNGSPDLSSVLSAYGEGKRLSELMGNIFQAETKIEFISARCFAFAGHYISLDRSFAFGNFLNNVRCGKPIIIKGDGLSYRSYLYAGDLIIWLIKILVYGKSGEAYNVGSDEEIMIKDLAFLFTKYSKNSQIKNFRKRK